MTAFHPFPRLPWEVRARIWELTVEPRTVEVNIEYEKTTVTDDMRARYSLAPDTSRWISILRLRSSTAVPAPLQACREARIHLTEGVGGLGNYRKAFHQLLAAINDGKEMPLQLELRLELGLGLEPRYVWVNFEMDMISIGQSMFTLFEPYYQNIKRLKFARDRNEWFCYFESKELRNFAKVREVYVVCLDGLDCWQGAEECCFPYSIENVLLIDWETGKTETPFETDARWDEIRAANYRKEGARINLDTHVPFVPWLPPGWFEGQEEWDDYYGDW
ncbi:hypothetical protein QBC32DRAFT_343930 [Pseudoneurospora amorphoporcata]|uniref:2EXR domain-containing protein n=1 Tax=Pseudoneurospora amorphoporcata TaxID=241081 RepID=A0AAN6SFN6_9PEZI|nr:hypothetical protein QBC32DRAFT_343930 [Pseudoneurospora amorphoporcata]